MSQMAIVSFMTACFWWSSPPSIILISDLLSPSMLRSSCSCSVRESGAV